MNEEEKEFIRQEIDDRMSVFLGEFQDLTNSYNKNRYSDRRTFEETVEFLGMMFINSATPSQITANQNNYQPSKSTLLRLSTDASRNITGLKGGVRGRVLIIINVGSNNLVLQDENASSDAGNRIATHSGGDITLGAEDGALLWYDVTSLRWRLILNS